MSVRRWLVPAVASVLLTAGLAGQGNGPRAAAAIQPAPMREWLTYLASDELQGREVYSEGLGLAASYIADRLKEGGVKPAADGSYFQTVKVLGIRTTSRSTVTVEVNGQRRTFKDGEGITLPRNMGGKQTRASDDVWFAGYGLQVPSARIDDYADVDPKGRTIVWFGAAGPRDVTESRLLAGRSRLATEKGAVAVIGPAVSGRGRGAAAAPAAAAAPPAAEQPATATPPAAATQPAPASDTPAPPAGRGQVAGGRGASTPDFVTAQAYEQPAAPVVTAQDEFFELLFSASEVSYSQLKELAAKREPLPHFRIAGVKLTFDVDPEYAIVSTRLTRNVVGMVEGADPALKDSYVAFGAHYDHIGYLQSGSPGRGSAAGASGCAGQTRSEPRPGDIVNNGADDDGSGTVALMAIARAFAAGPRPKRSLLFVWHTGEESGLHGSRYNADHPIVPNEKVVAQLNADMIGRNRCDDPAEANTVYLIGSDRISTELHDVSEQANAAMARPLALDYELNDPADPQSLYTRSDHYSYAAKGIPVIFSTTGLHRDYHAVTDEVGRIEWDKLSRVAQLIYATGQRLANLDHAPVRDNKGARAR